MVSPNLIRQSALAPDQFQLRLVGHNYDEHSSLSTNASSPSAPAIDSPIGALPTLLTGIDTCGSRPMPAMAVKESVRR
jgi:hypothetical protein